MTYEFVAIDFETANEKRASACNVGLALIVDGVVVRKEHFLIKPPTGPKFSSWATAIHGLTARDVRSAPSWPEALRRIEDFVAGRDVLAHNAGFDLGVLRAASLEAGLEWPEFDFACSLVVSRRIYPLTSHSLPFVADYNGIEGLQHHDAGSDAAVAGMVAVAEMKALGVDTLPEMMEALGLQMGRQTASYWYGPSSGDKMRFAPANPVRRSRAARLLDWVRWKFTLPATLGA